jgi:hypothetical protein
MSEELKNEETEVEAHHKRHGHDAAAKPESDDDDFELHRKLGGGPHATADPEADDDDFELHRKLGGHGTT